MRLEDDLREALRRRAEQVTMPKAAWPSIDRRVSGQDRRTRFARVATASVALAVAAVVVVWLGLVFAGGTGPARVAQSGPGVRISVLVPVDHRNGAYPVAVAMGKHGLPIVAYVTQHLSVNVVTCSDAACTSAARDETVDTSGDVGFHVSLAVAPDGNPVMAYVGDRNDPRGDLKVAACGDPTCSTGNTVTVVDKSGQVGDGDAALVIGADGLPVVAYYDTADHGLKVVGCGNPACSSDNTLSIVDRPGVDNIFGLGLSMAVGSDGRPAIAYRDAARDDVLKVAKCGTPDCSRGNVVAVVDPSQGWGLPSIAVGPDELPVVVYGSNVVPHRELRVARCGDPACSSHNAVTTLHGLYQGTDEVSLGAPSIAVPSDGLPAIVDTVNVSYSAAGPVRVVKCGNLACSSGNVITTLDRGGMADLAAVAIGGDGLPVIALDDAANGGEIKVAKCLSITCG
jgi:hypothetical protein